MNFRQGILADLASAYYYNMTFEKVNGFLKKQAILPPYPPSPKPLCDGLHIDFLDFLRYNERNLERLFGDER